MALARWVVLAGLVVVLLFAADAKPSPHMVLRDQYDSQIAALQAQASQLQGQLSGVQGEQAGAAAAANAADAALTQTEEQLAAAQQRVNELNLELAQTAAKLAVAKANLAKDRASLASMTVNTYERQAQGYSLNAVVESSSLTQALDRVEGMQHVNTSMTRLATTVMKDQQELETLQAQQAAEEQAAVAAANQLSALEAQEQVQSQQAHDALNAITGQAGALMGQIAGVNHQIGVVRQQQAAAIAAAAAAAARSHGGGGIVRSGALPPFAFGGRDDSYPWGQCTWYVASLRDVTWPGDAWTWAGNAAAQGYAESHSPRAGSIVVWGAGNGYSGFGHVAYVVSVQGPTSFTVDEANYVGLGVVDQRQVFSLNDVEAFIL